MVTIPGSRTRVRTSRNVQQVSPLVPMKRATSLTHPLLPFILHRKNVQCLALNMCVIS